MNPNDRALLRDLAKRYAEVAALPVMDERREAWKQHNSLQSKRPLILIFAEGAWTELLPESALECTEEHARTIEWELRHKLYWHKHLPDDYVFEPRWPVSKVRRTTDWGVETQQIDSPAHRGAWAFSPVIHDAADLEKLRFPEVEYDHAATMQTFEEMASLFDGILEVYLKGIGHISFHLMALYTRWRGLEQVMLDMCQNPNMLHDAMAFLEEGHHRLVKQYEALNLLSLNNDDTYHSSGGVGYTNELPQADCDPDRVRPCDMWASAEAQELAQVGPEMHEEFSLQYERRLLAPFGLNGYGCCEDLALKMDDVFRIPNIRRISISPFSDVATCAERLEDRYILSWKPHPAHIVGGFDEDHVRQYIRRALEAAKGCVVEMILKDTHTCENHPERFTRWAQIARECVEEA